LDTYDTMRSGLPNAITVARELAERGETLRGVRLDSGDLGALAREVRRGLDEAGFMKVQIVASDQLDEQVMSELIADGAPIDLFGVGTAIATGAPDGALDGVYKLAQTGETPRLKASETLGKATLPGRKTVTRYRDAAGVLRADAIHLAGESTPERLWHPFEPEEGLDLRDWEGAPLLEPVVREGRPVRPLPSVAEAARRARESVEALSPGLRRFDSPETYAVGLSEALRSLRDRLLNAKRKGLPK
ncbi:MAG: nicotinate phosphoribosyltransferase, partial [Opitutales bacterium]